MKVIAVLTTFGELVGRVADDFDFNSEKVLADGAFLLEQPLKSVMLPTPQGMANAMLPPSQFLNCREMPVPNDTVLLIGDAPEELAAKYLQMVTGIAMPKAGPTGGRIIL